MILIINFYWHIFNFSLLQLWWHSRADLDKDLCTLSFAIAITAIWISSISWSLISSMHIATAPLSVPAEKFNVAPFTLVLLFQIIFNKMLTMLKERTTRMSNYLNHHDDQVNQISCFVLRSICSQAYPAIENTLAQMTLLNLMCFWCGVMREKVSSPKNIFQKSLGLKKLTVKFGGAFKASNFWAYCRNLRSFTNYY